MTDQNSSIDKTPSPIELSQSSHLSTSSFVIYIAVFLVVWALRATVFIHIDESITSGVGKNLYSNAVKFALWVLPVFIALFVLRLRPLIYTKLTTPLNVRGLIISSIVVIAWLSIAVVGESLISGKSVAVMLTQKAPAWLSILAGVFLSPIWEEIMFRGFVLNRLDESLSFWKANVISALLFMLTHVPYWVSKTGLSGPVIKDLINVFLLGCLFGWVMKKTNSLWPAIGAHIANNFISGLIH